VVGTHHSLTRLEASAVEHGDDDRFAVVTPAPLRHNRGRPPSYFRSLVTVPLGGHATELLGNDPDEYLDMAVTLCQQAGTGL